MTTQRAEGGRVLVSAFMYDPHGVSEAWTAHQLVNALRQRGRRLTVFTAALPGMPQWYGVARLKCFSEADRPFFSPLNYSEFSLRGFFLGRRLRRRFALVHHVSPITIRIPSIFGKLGRPFIWGPVGGSIPYPPGFEVYGKSLNVVNVLRRLDRPRLRFDPSMRFTMSSANRIVVTTSMAAELIPDRYRDKTLVVPEGVPDDLVLPAPGPEEAYIFSSGRLIEYKAMDLLIKAFGRLRSADGLKLIITGEGPEKPKLQVLIDELGLQGRAELRGRVPREENKRLMSRALCCVFPALREAFGHVNLEAMGAWKPIIVTDWGGPRDLVETNVSGIKVLGKNPEEHVEQLTAAMDRLINNAELRRQIGTAAAHRVKTEYMWPVLAVRYDKLYQELS